MKKEFKEPLIGAIRACSATGTVDKIFDMFGVKSTKEKCGILKDAMGVRAELGESETYKEKYKGLLESFGLGYWRASMEKKK